MRPSDVITDRSYLSLLARVLFHALSISCYEYFVYFLRFLLLQCYDVIRFHHNAYFLAMSFFYCSFRKKTSWQHAALSAARCVSKNRFRTSLALRCTREDTEPEGTHTHTRFIPIPDQNLNSAINTAQTIRMSEVFAKNVVFLISMVSLAVGMSLSSKSAKTVSMRFTFWSQQSPLTL